MKAENIMDAMGRLEEDLLMENLPVKRHNFRPLIAVAAVAAALAVTVGAVHLIAPDFFREDDNYVVQMEYGGTALAPEKVQELLELGRAGRQPGNIPIREFDSLAQMEADLGLDLLDSPLRVQHGCHYLPLYDPGQELKVFLFYHPYTEPEGGRSDDKLAVAIYAYLSVQPDESIGWVFSEEERLDWAGSEIYEVKQLGVAARILPGKGPGYTEAWFSKDGIGYEVSCRGGVQTMRAVLDSIE